MYVFSLPTARCQLIFHCLLLTASYFSMLVAYCQLYFTVYCLLLYSINIVYNCKTKVDFPILYIINFNIIDLRLLYAQLIQGLSLWGGGTRRTPSPSRRKSPSYGPVTDHVNCMHLLNFISHVGGQDGVLWVFPIPFLSSPKFSPYVPRSSLPSPPPSLPPHLLPSTISL